VQRAHHRKHGLVAKAQIEEAAGDDDEADTVEASEEGDADDGDDGGGENGGPGGEKAN